MAKKQFEMKQCPWELLKENDQGDLYWCSRCGATYAERDPPARNTLANASAVDRDTLYCPDQGLVP